jgi:hypothetical protein
MTDQNIKECGIEAFGTAIFLEKDQTIEVVIPKYFRDEGWANGMGAIQDAISQYSLLKTISSHKIIINFILCRWIDPLPLMSILLEIINAQQIGMNVEIILPNPDDCQESNKGPYQESPNRLLLFLAKEGFFECIESLNDGKIKFSDDIFKNWKKLLNLKVKPSYGDSRCVPITIFRVPYDEVKDFAKTSVESLLESIGPKLDSKVAPQSQEQLVYKLRVALQEALHNAQEHAYTNDESPRLLLLYVRFRRGGIGLDSISRYTHQICVKEEDKHCPKLRKDWLNTRPGCLEVFVIDRGIGMVQSFEKAGVILEGKYKFKEVMKKTFYDGNSTKPERQTRYGGLHLLHNLLIETGDYLRALEGGIWFGCGVPINRETECTHQITKNNSVLKGLAIHLRMGWKEETDHGEKWVKFVHANESEVWPELVLSETDCIKSFEWFKSQTIIDERFGKIKTFGDKSNWVLWLVKPHHMKWDILFFIERNIIPLMNEKSVLIIAEDRKSTRLNSSHNSESRMPSSA